MWIVLAIVAFLALLITVILLLPVYIIIQNDENDELQILYKILFKTFGEEPDPDNPILKGLKKSSGLARIEKQSLQKTVDQSGVYTTVAETVRLMWDLLKEVAGLLKFCTVKTFWLDVVCSGDDAVEAAMDYGQCCAVVYPVAGALSALMRVRKSAWDMDIRCDFEGGDAAFDYRIVLSVRVFRLLAAFFRVALAEAKRTVEEEEAEARRASASSNQSL